MAFGSSSSVLVVALFSLTSSSALWPYLQIYPPVNETDDRTPLYFALMLSFGGDYVSIGALPGIQIALDYINSEASILPGYSLHYTLTDSQCNRTVAIDSFFREVNRPPTKVGWVGSGCSVATEPTAELSQFLNITQLSCTSTYHVGGLSYYFQLLSSSNILSLGFFAIINHFRWRKVSILTQNEKDFVEMTDNLKRYLTSAGIQYTERVFSSRESIGGLGAEPFDVDSRVFILAMYSTHAHVLACEAYRRGISYPTHQFLLYGWYRNDWLVERLATGSTSTLSCSLEERTQALQYAISVRALDFNTHRTLVTEGDLTLAKFEQQYREKISDPINTELNLGSLVQSNEGVFSYSQQCHEATLTLAKALHLVSRDLNDSNQTLNREAGKQAGLEEGENFTLANFSYSNSAILQRMFHHISSTDFLGITGKRVSFNSNRTRPVDKLVIYQYHPAESGGSVERVEIGTVPVETATFSLASHLTQTNLFPLGVPTDGIPDSMIVTVAPSVTAVLIIFSVCGICFAIMCLVFNFICRKRKLMVLSGTSLNYIVGLGSIILLLGVIIAAIPLTDETSNSVMCNLLNSLTSIGFSLTNGTIAMKVMRIWYIHNRPKLNKKLAIRDVHIFIAIMILVGMDTIIIGLYFLIGGVKGQVGVALIPNRENPVDLIGPTKRIIENYFYTCSGPGPRVLFPVLIGDKVFLLVIALVFSLRTRKVKQDGQDDSKYIAASVYVMNVVSVVIIVSNISLVGFLNTRLVVLCLSHLLGNIAVLCLVFIPKMVAIYRDPKGKNVVMSGSGVVVGAPHQYTVTTQDERELEGLRQRLKHLEDTLKQYGSEEQEDDQEDEEEPQRKVMGGERPPDVQSSLDDTGIDLRSVPNSHISRSFVTD